MFVLDGLNGSGELEYHQKWAYGRNEMSVRPDFLDSVKSKLIFPSPNMSAAGWKSSMAWIMNKKRLTSVLIHAILSSICLFASQWHSSTELHASACVAVCVFAYDQVKCSWLSKPFKMIWIEVNYIAVMSSQKLTHAILHELGARTANVFINRASALQPLR